MKLTWIILAALVPVFLAIGLAGGAQGDDLQAVYNLSGVLRDLENRELAVTFSDDMLPLGGQRDGASLVRITPAIEGEFLWRGNRTLAFKPKPRFRYSTTYTAVIPAGTRSLAGKTLPREVRWQWSTPQATPVEAKPSSREYFSPLRPGAKLDFQVWVKDSLVLRFNQPVSAAEAGGFFLLKETKSGKLTPIRLLQKGGDGIEVRCEKELRRGVLYQFTITKGFHGSEGKTGTAKDFIFTFDTVPPFQFAGKEPLVLFPDAPVAWLPFANELAEFDKNLIQVFRITGAAKSPLKSHGETHYYRNQDIYLRVDDELASGDRLSIRIDRNLANIFKERLVEDLDIEAKVCSSRSPRLDFSLREGKLSLSAKSMKRADILLFKFRPAFHSLLHKLEPGILQRQEFHSEFVEKEIRQQLTDLPERRNQPELMDKELGSPLGFFGLLAQRYEPYNACQDTWLMRLPAHDPPALRVFHRRHMDMVIKAGQQQTLFWLYDNRSGKGLANRPFELLRPGEETITLGTSSADGILVSGRAIGTDDLVVARDTGKEDMALARIAQKPLSDREVRVSVFSDRDFYKPGDTVHIAGIVKEHASGKISSPKARLATLEILGPDWQKVKSDQVELDSLGGFHYPFSSDPAGKRGNYNFQVKVNDGRNWQGQHAVVIDYYQPNTFEIMLAGIAERYLSSDTLHARVSGSYLAGNPMAGDSLAHALDLSPAGSRIFAAENLQRFAFALDHDLMQNDAPSRGEGKLDASGRTTLDIPLSRFSKTNYLAGLNLSATGKSAEGKEFTAYSRSLFFPGKRVTGIRLGYYQSLREPVKAELALVDSQGKPASGEVRATLYREHYQNSRRRLEKASEPRDLFIDQFKTHAFRVTEAGRYILRIDTPDGSGRVVSTSHGFFAWDSGYADRDDRLRIESEQSVLRKGETLKCFIRSPRPGQALVTVERGAVLDSWVVPLQKMTPLDIPVRKEYFPAVRVGVVAMYENNISEETSKDFQVRDEGKSLKIDIECAGEIKPASKAEVQIRVRDALGRGARAKLFVYAVDEGNLSLQDYQTPDQLQRFYYDTPLGRGILRNQYSKHFNHWTIEHPLMDIDLPAGPVLFGRVFRPDASPLAGAAVTLEDENFKKLRTTTSSPQGYYAFIDVPAGRYAVKAQARGFHPFLQEHFHFGGRGRQACHIALIPASADMYRDQEDADAGIVGGVEGGVEGASAPAPMADAKRMKAQKLNEKLEITGKADISGIRVRSDFKEVLFFQVVETDGAGNVPIEFESSDQLSSYRIMAVAYSEDCFGSAERKLVVSKDLLISEAMPEFARQGDEFTAGAQLSNRTAHKLPFTLLAKPAGIAVSGKAQVENILDPRGNGLFQFPFLADRIGEAKVEFFALSAADKDGLEKKLAVTDRLVSETLLDFASGRNVKKTIAPQAEGEQQAVAIKVAPSLLRPVVHIAKKLVFYPYECLEQRTSKVMPLLALSPQLAERLELGLDQEQIRAEIEGFLKIIPEFMNSDGALSYYRGGQYSSDYLTAYVLWSLHLARERDYKVDPQLVQKLSAHLQRADLDTTCESFYQFVLSLHKNADGKKLKKLAEERDALPLPARVFLYRALHNQGPETNLLKAMLDEFNNSLQVEADFAYFDAGEFRYHRDYPFYSSRFATALLLQAVLEVERGHVLAERIVNWLLEAEPHCWNTTQTNFWILCAMDEYLKQVEKTTASRAEVTLLGERTAKEFAGSRDTLRVQKKLEGRKEPVEVAVQADQPVYVTSELTWKLSKAGKKSRGIDIRRNVYNEKGESVTTFMRGQTYMVELLVNSDKEVPYGIVDEPLAAGFELLRQDVSTTRSLKEFNTQNQHAWRAPWARQENSADRLVYYTYLLQGRMRMVYFIKAMYSGRFTWMPAVAQGMYHPQYFGRTAIQRIEVSE